MSNDIQKAAHTFIKITNMKNTIAACILFLVVLLAYTEVAQAAFPVFTGTHKEAPHTKETIRERIRWQFPFTLKNLKKHIATHYTDEHASETDAASILSLVFGLVAAVSAVSIVSFFFSAAGLIFIISAFVFGLAAVILGAFRKRRNNAAGVTGLILGAAALTVVLAIMSVVLLF